MTKRDIRALGWRVSSAVVVVNGLLHLKAVKTTRYCVETGFQPLNTGRFRSAATVSFIRLATPDALNGAAHKGCVGEGRLTPADP
jgi:hypothetical protein